MLAALLRLAQADDPGARCRLAALAGMQLSDADIQAIASQVAISDLLQMLRNWDNRYVINSVVQ